MMKAYRISDPYALKQLGELVKDGTARLNALARVWNVERNVHFGTSSWGDDIQLVFRTEGRKRYAEIIRRNAPQKRQLVAELRYNDALAFARDHFEPVQ